MTDLIIPKRFLPKWWCKGFYFNEKTIMNKKLKSFFECHLHQTFNCKDDFIPLSKLSYLTGHTESYLLEKAKFRTFDVWFEVPEDVETKTFRISGIMLSEIKCDLDYLSLCPGFSSSAKYINEQTEFVMNVGVLIPMKYLMISFQDLRWNAKNSFCVFTRGYQDRIDDPDHSNSANESIIPFVNRIHDYTKFESTPRVFVTCKKGDDSNILTESRVVRFPVSDMKLYVERINVNCFISEIADEMSLIKSVLLKFLDLENMNFIAFPEKLFYVFVVTYRNLNCTKLGFKINRNNVVNELSIFGFTKKMSDYLSTLIINVKRKDKEKKKKYTKKIDDGKDFFEELNVMGLFRAFAHFYKKNVEPTTADITTYLTAQYNYADEVAIKVSSIVSGNDKAISWECLKSIYKPEFLKKLV